MLVRGLDFLHSLWFNQRNSTRRLYGTQAHTSRRLLFSSALASAAEDSRPRHTSSEGIALFTARNTSSRSSAAMTRALAVPHADSKTAVCSRGSFDGSDRDHFFPRMIGVFATFASNQTMKRIAAGLKCSFPMAKTCNSISASLFAAIRLSCSR